MAAIILSHQRMQQPQVNPPIISTPIQWLRVWDAKQKPVELLSNKFLAITGSVVPAVIGGEVMANVLGTSQTDNTQFIDTGATIAGHGITNTFTFLVRGYWSAPSWNSFICGDEATSVDAAAIQVAWLTGNTGIFRVCDSGGTAHDAPAPTLVLNKLYTIVGTYDGTTIKWWMNGSYVGSAAMSGNVYSSNSNFCLGKRGGVGASYPYPLNGGVSLAALSKSVAPDAYAQSLSANPWQIFQPLNRAIYSGAAAFFFDPRYARPSADVTIGAWSPNSGSHLYPMLNEVTESDAEYITSGSPTVCDLTLGPVVDPLTSANQVVTIRAKSAYGSTLTAVLMQGATTIATRTYTSMSSAYTDYQMSLTGGECDAITDYTALHITLTSS